MTLSVCCLTRDPGARVAAILGQLRAVADEIVVAVDARLDPALLGRYAEAADKLLRYEFVDSCQQALPWIVHRCSGDWILLIDGDEVLSQTLVERLPELIASREVFQYWLPCFWLYPDAARYLTAPPWQFSTPRLVRNDPATLWHAGLSHGRFEPVFPAMHLQDGFYHLSLLINDVAFREAKVDHYLGIASGHERRVLELDVTAFYLPERERTFGMASAPVPERDRPAIEQALNARGEELPGPPPEEVPTYGWSEIQRSWPRRALPASAYHGSIELFERDPALFAGERRSLTVRVGNEGTEDWPGLDREPCVRVSHRWLTPGAPDDTATWRHTRLPAPLAQGSSALVPVALEIPARAGRHTVELSLAHEDLLHERHLARFATVSVSLQVRKAERSPWWEPPTPARAPGASAPRRPDGTARAPGLH